MYLELHSTGAKSLIGSVHKHINKVYSPAAIEERVGFALQRGTAKYAFAVSLFRTEAIWARIEGKTRLLAGNLRFRRECTFRVYQEGCVGIDTAVVGDRIGRNFSAAEQWAEQVLSRSHMACAVVIDTTGVRAAWWRNQDETILIAHSARSQNGLFII